MDLPVTRLRPRQVGALRLIELDERLNVMVEFAVPTPLEELEVEALTESSYDIIKRSPMILARYGLGESTLTEDQTAACYMHVRLIEAAVKFWKRWNVAFTDGPVDPINYENVRALLIDSNIRTLWAVHLADACSLEPQEGNVSAASPGTPMDEAAIIAETAPKSESAAPEVSPSKTASSARKSRTRRARPKASSSDA